MKLAWLFAGAGLLAPSSALARAETASVLVQQVPVVQRSVRETVTVYGQAEADPDAVLTISLPHSGLVTRVAVRLGQRLKRGATLFELTTSPAAHMQFLQARTAVDYARRELTRQARLLAEQLTTQARLDGARKALRDAKTGLQALTAQGQDKTTETVSAPIDGIVTRLGVKQGDRVQADTAALAIASGDRLIARLGLEPEDIRLLGAGAPVLVRSVFVPEFRADTRLREIHAMINPATHLVDALAPIPTGQTDHLVLGSRLTAAIQLKAYRAMTVPRSAVLQDEKGSYLFRVVDGRARRVEVTTRLETDRWVVVEGKLEPGDIIVSAGNYELRDGMPVRDGG